MIPQQQRAMTPVEWGLLLFLSLLWGASFFFVGVIVKELPPLTIVALRVAIAALALWVTGPLTGVSLARIRSAAASLLLMAVFNNVLPFSLLVWAQTKLPSGFAAILNASTPLLTVLAAHVLTTSEKLTPMRMAGAALGLAGVAWMVGPDLSSGLSGSFLAELACVLAAAFYALSSIFGRRFSGLGLKPIDIATGQLSAASLVLIPAALFVDHPWALAAPSMSTVAAIIAFACFSTALAYIVFFRILAGAGATNVGLVTLLVPVTTIALGALALGERLELRHFVGLALIAAGLAFIDGRLPRRLSHALGIAPAPV